jgi:hypothetical protein
MHKARRDLVRLTRLALAWLTLLGAAAGCGSGGGSETGGAAPSGTSEADDGSGDGGTFADECPSVDALSANLGVTLTLEVERGTEKTYGMVSELGCTYRAAGPDFRIMGYRDRFDDLDDAVADMDVFDISNPASIGGGPRPQDIIGDLDRGDGGYANTRVHQRADGLGYDNFAIFAFLVGMRRCHVQVMTSEAPAPGLTPVQEDAGMSVLTALCDV